MSDCLDALGGTRLAPRWKRLLVAWSRAPSKWAPEDASAEMAETSSYLIRGDSSRNLVEVRYGGRVTASVVKDAFKEVMNLLPNLRSGFTLVVDLSELESMDLDCVGDITKIMDACNAAGIGTVVRIIPDPRKDIGLNILSIIHYRRGVHVLTFQNSAEAERAL